MTVNVVAPGLIDTDMTTDLGAAREDDGGDDPDGPHRHGRADVAGVVGFLASDDARYITGAVIGPDGGLVDGPLADRVAGPLEYDGPRQKPRGISMDRNEAWPSSRDNTVEVLAVDPAQVTPEASFADDLGADSLDLVELVMALEETFDIEVGEDELKDISTVGEAFDLIYAKL